MHAAESELRTWAAAESLPTVKGGRATIGSAVHPRDGSTGPGFRFDAAEILPNGSGIEVWRTLGRQFESASGPEAPPVMHMAPDVPPAAAVVTAEPRRGRPLFEGALAAARREYVRQRVADGVPAEVAGRLFDTNGTPSLDALTGWQGAPTRTLDVVAAVAHSARTHDIAYYVEADIRNLGGLNRVLGPVAADAVFRMMGESIAADMRAIGVEVAPHRHGGDELSFIIVAPNPARDASGRIITPEAWQALVATTLSRAEARVQARIAQSTYVGSDGVSHSLSDIAHTKPDQPPGTGVTLGFSRVVPPDTPAGLTLPETYRAIAAEAIETTAVLIEYRKKNRSHPLDVADPATPIARPAPSFAPRSVTPESVSQVRAQLATSHPDAHAAIAGLTDVQFGNLFGASSNPERVAGLSTLPAWRALVESNPQAAQRLADMHLQSPHDVVAMVRDYGIETAGLAASLHAESPAELGALVRQLGSREAALTALHDSPTETAAIAQQAAEHYVGTVDPSGRLGFRALSGSESRSMLSDARFYDRDVSVRDALADSGLEPRYEMIVDETRIALSEPFPMEDGRQGIIGYVESNGQVHARMYYRSNSQAAWRVTDTVTGGQHFGKGIGESDTLLPIDLNIAIHRMVGEGSTPLVEIGTRRTLSATEAGAQAAIIRPLVARDRTYAGDTTAVEHHGIHYYSTEYGAGRSSRPVGSHGRELATPGQIVAPPAPSEIRLPSDAQLADFSQPPVDRFEIQASALAGITGDGRISAEVYLSRDGRTRYLVGEDAAGRIFVLGAESTASGVSSFGNRAESVELHGMDAPLFEYGSQIATDYGGSRDSRYHLNWAYVRETPLVREIYRARGLEPPPALPNNVNPTRSLLRAAPSHVREAYMGLMGSDATHGLANAPLSRERMSAIVDSHGAEGAALLVRMGDMIGEAGLLRLFADSDAGAHLMQARSRLTPEALLAITRMPSAERLAALQTLIAPEHVVTAPAVDSLPPPPPDTPASSEARVIEPSQLVLGENAVPEHLLEAMEGSSANVLRSQLSIDGVSQDVVVKIFRRSDVNARAYFDHEVEMLTALNGMGLGPRVEGVVTLPDGRFGVVMEQVAGVFPEIGVRITHSSVRQLAGAMQTIHDAGYTIGDFQYLVGPTGEVRIIDAGGMQRLSESHLSPLNIQAETMRLRLAGLGEGIRMSSRNTVTSDLEAGRLNDVMTDAQTSHVLELLESVPSTRQVGLTHDAHGVRLAVIDVSAGGGWSWDVYQVTSDGQVSRVVSEAFDARSQRVSVQQPTPVDAAPINIRDVALPLAPLPEGLGQWAAHLERHRETFQAHQGHLKLHDISGVRIELAGVEIPKPNGGVFDHVREMRNTRRGVAGLVKALRNMEAGMQRSPDVTPQALEAIAQMRQRSESMLALIDQTLLPVPRSNP